MEERDNITLRITSKVKSVYDGIGYHKRPIVLKFIEKYRDEVEYFSSVYRGLIGLPTGLVGYKHSITISGVSRIEAEAFIGYIIKVLVSKSGDVAEAISYVKEDLR